MSAGSLVLVATPIGNLTDVSERVVSTLSAADIIASEDTRRTRKLLSAAGIRGGNKLVSLNRDNERKQAGYLVEQMRKGRKVAVVSDAGMPALADPGEILVRKAAEVGIEVSVVPGPSAITAAVVVSGLPTGRFTFESFLPRTPGDRRRRLDSLAGEARTMVFFEAPGRTAASLAAMAEVFGGGRRCAVCRELTKIHEEVFRGTLARAAEAFAGEVLGEVVIVVDGTDVADSVGDDAVREYLDGLLAGGTSVRDAAAAAASDLGVRKKHAYRLALERDAPNGPGT